MPDTQTTEYSQPLHERLSRLEYRVFHKLANGKQRKIIAQELEIAESTIGSVWKRIKDKTGWKNVQDLAVYAHQNGMRP